MFTLKAFIDATNEDTCKQSSQVPTSSHPAQHDTSGTGLHVSASASDSDTSNAKGFGKSLRSALSVSAAAAAGGGVVVSLRFLPIVVVTGYVVGVMAESAEPEPEDEISRRSSSLAPDDPTSSSSKSSLLVVVTLPVVDALVMPTVGVLRELTVVRALVAYVVV